MEIIALGDVLIDTSIWIEYFHGNPSLVKEVLSLIELDRVCCTGIIVAELLQGTSTEKDAKGVLDLVESFRNVELTSHTWASAGLLSAKLRRNGVIAPLSDCAIATVAHANELAIFTKDKHFTLIQKVLKTSIHKPSGATH